MRSMASHGPSGPPEASAAKQGLFTVGYGRGAGPRDGKRRRAAPPRASRSSAPARRVRTGPPVEPRGYGPGAPNGEFLDAVDLFDVATRRTERVCRPRSGGRRRARRGGPLVRARRKIATGRRGSIGRRSARVRRTPGRATLAPGRGVRRARRALPRGARVSRRVQGGSRTVGRVRTQRRGSARARGPPRLDGRGAYMRSLAGFALSSVLPLSSRPPDAEPGSHPNANP
jgi:hypothetical protein